MVGRGQQILASCIQRGTGDGDAEVVFKSRIHVRPGILAVCWELNRGKRVSADWLLAFVANKDRGRLASLCREEFFPGLLRGSDSGPLHNLRREERRNALEVGHEPGRGRL